MGIGEDNGWEAGKTLRSTWVNGVRHEWADWKIRKGRDVDWNEKVNVYMSAQ